MPLFERLQGAIGCPNEALERETIYRKVSTDNFFDVLDQATDRLAVLELSGVLWSEWNRPERIAETLRRIDRQPAFPLTCLDRPFIPFTLSTAVGHDNRSGISPEINAIAERALHQVRAKRATGPADAPPGTSASHGQRGPAEATVEANV
jgi:hypothetical protein